MTYATKQLTHALQELTSRGQQGESQTQAVPPSVIPAESLVFSKEVENYLDRKKAYALKTRDVSVGSY